MKGVTELIKGVMSTEWKSSKELAKESGIRIEQANYGIYSLIVRGRVERLYPIVKGRRNKEQKYRWRKPWYITNQDTNTN